MSFLSTHFLGHLSHCILSDVIVEEVPEGGALVGVVEAGEVFSESVPNSLCTVQEAIGLIMSVMELVARLVMLMGNMLLTRLGE